MAESARARGMACETDRRALAELVFLKNLPGVGKRTINKYCTEPLRRELEAERCAAELCAEWLQPGGVHPAGPEIEAAAAAAKRVLKWLDRHPDVRAVSVFDEAYPEKLRDLGLDQPPVLYIRRQESRPDMRHGGRINESEGEGKLAPERKTSGAERSIAAPGRKTSGAEQSIAAPGCCLGVIGSRWPGDRIFREAPALLEKWIRETGLVVISGLARGCDAIGHRAAIAAGGVTGAILPCGIDRVVPAMHAELAGEILRTGGFLMSEYDPGTEAADYRYVERDRLTAALSDGLLVLECGMRSGTMQTVKAAVSLGRPLACLFPGDGETAAEGNLYMRDHYSAVVVRNSADLTVYADELRTTGRKEIRRRPGSESESNGGEQLSFLEH